MPQGILDRLVSQLKADGKDEAAAREIAVAQLTRHGILDEKGALTAKGREREALGASGRAKDRAAKASGGKHRASDYTYDHGTNRATLRPKSKTGWPRL